MKPIIKLTSPKGGSGKKTGRRETRKNGISRGDCRERLSALGEVLGENRTLNGGERNGEA